MNNATELPGVDFLNDAGLNRQHVFDLARLPSDLVADLQPEAGERQLILFGHGGRRLWECVQAEGLDVAHPIDEYSMRTALAWFVRTLPERRARIVFPGGQRIGLQRLGALAGWHHRSPFMLGMDARWGSWFAYRVVLLADTALPPTPVLEQAHPCAACAAQPCVTACPAAALAGGKFNQALCGECRLAPDSPCALACVARNACPVGAEHRYEESLIRHSASYSYATIAGAGCARLRVGGTGVREVEVPPAGAGPGRVSATTDPTVV